MELTKRMQEKDRGDILGNYDTSPEEQKSVNEGSSCNQHTKESQVKPLLQAIVGLL